MDIQIRNLELDAIEFDIGKGCLARALVYPGMGSIYRSMHYIEIPELLETHELFHSDSEAAYYITQGTGSIKDLSTEETFALRKGKMILLDAATRYRIEAEKGETMILIGGPCPPDPALYAKS